MPRRIKQGEGTLIGNAGEYFVVAELLKRGVVAALAPRNTPGFDLLAARGSKTVKVRVKTKTEEYDCWQWNAKKNGSIFLGLSPKDDFIVLVNLTQETKEMDYFILPTVKIDGWLQKLFQDWVGTPGKKGQQHDRENKRRIIYYKEFGTELEPFKNQWEIMWA